MTHREWLLDLEARVRTLEMQAINYEKFYLAFRISQCPHCNSRVIDWELPIILKADKIPSLCKKHMDELTELNRKYASD